MTDCEGNTERTKVTQQELREAYEIDELRSYHEDRSVSQRMAAHSHHPSHCEATIGGHEENSDDDATYNDLTLGNGIRVAVDEKSNQQQQKEHEPPTTAHVHETLDINVKMKEGPLSEKAPSESNENRKQMYAVLNRIKKYCIEYCRKWSGVKGQENMYQRPTWLYMLLAFIGSFLGIFSVAAIQYYAFNNPYSSLHIKGQLTMLIGSFGASAVLIYGEVRSPLAQPRNFIGGHFVSSLVGIIIRLILSYTGKAEFWLTPFACALAVASAITFMHLTRTTHPPGGATALIAVTSPLVSFQLLLLGS
jgi:hypothetical protein